MPEIRGWKLPKETRAALLDRFPPRYASIVADHVTMKPDDAAMPEIRVALVVGHADDRIGVEALIVAINGNTARPDGSIWHITWSLAQGRKAKESNDVIMKAGWTPFDHAMDIPLVPAKWTRRSD